MEIYERISKVYDLDWGIFSSQYTSLISQILKNNKIQKAKILDLACGTGVLVLELAKLGHSVMGIDNSPHMIEIAKSKSTDNLDISFEIKDMTNFSMDKKFDLVTCTFDSLNYLVNLNNLKTVFSNAAEALNENGLFIFDSNTEKLYLSRHKGKYERELKGLKFTQKLKYDRETKIAKTVFEFPDGEKETHKQRPYSFDEIKSVLSEHNFKILKTYADFEKRPYCNESERLICIAEWVNGSIGE